MAFALAKSVPLDANVEYYAFRFRVGDAKSVGTGACAGCSVPMCLLLTSLNVVGATLGEQRIVSQPLVNNMIYFNSGSTAPCIVPTRATTWGAVKSLYR